LALELGRREGRKKKKQSLAKNLIYFCHTPPGNGGDVMRMKKLSWKPEFGCQMASYTPSE
jgi:hypothetical protein